MIFRWFTSKTIRQALVVHKHYRHLFAAQRDLLSPPAIDAVQGKLDELRAAAKGGSKESVNTKAEELQAAAAKWLKPYPHANWRENVEVLLVALTVAMGIRTYFLQPFKIPTSSMQPTLFGVTSKNYLAPGGNADFQVPGGWERVKEWFEGTTYLDIVAQNDGRIEQIDPPVGVKVVNFWQKFRLGGREYTIWFPPDYGEPPAGVIPLAYRAGLEGDHNYKKGDPVIKLRMDAGDHLFVDRLSYNFRKPDRGDIIVFETAGISEDMRDNYRIPGDEFYIKRLVGLPGEKVSIGNDRHLRINGQRLDATTPHFENVYSFDDSQPPRDSQWSGHLNGTTAQAYGIRSIGNLPMFPNEETVFDVPPDSCLPMGDNTCVSLDSRFWGSMPEKYVIGRSFFVYWPLTSRFGYRNR
jgi:signal peptidase I